MQNGKNAKRVSWECSVACADNPLVSLRCSVQEVVVIRKLTFCVARSRRSFEHVAGWVEGTRSALTWLNERGSNKVGKRDSQALLQQTKGMQLWLRCFVGG